MKRISKEQEKLLDRIRNDKVIKENIIGIEKTQKRKLTDFEKEIYFLAFLEGGAFVSRVIEKKKWGKMKDD
jgi:DNA replication initiation complex subunit (GINS family)